MVIGGNRPYLLTWQFIFEVGFGGSDLRVNDVFGYLRIRCDFQVTAQAARQANLRELIVPNDRSQL